MLRVALRCGEERFRVRPDPGAQHADAAGRNEQRRRLFSVDGVELIQCGLTALGVHVEILAAAHTRRAYGPGKLKAHPARASAAGPLGDSTHSKAAA